MVSGPRVLKALLLSLSALLSGAVAQSGGNLDAHLISDPAAALYVRSSFAHGYRHGYEEGFHQADEDYHMGRDPQLLSCSEKKIKATKSPKVRGYAKHFGDKGNFASGYEHGYIAGYQDSFNGRSFRALALHQALLAKPELKSEALPEFDLGFGDGYRSFSFHSAIPATEEKCPKESPIYCDGFERGVVLGKADQKIATDSAGHVLAQK